MNKSEKFVELLERHKGLIYKVVNAYCKDRNNHQDLIQEIILQLWSSFDNYDDQFKISTWIYRIALNTAISNYRKAIASNNNFTKISPILADTLKSEEYVQEDSDLSLLYKFIHELKEIDRAIILLYLDDLRQKDIAIIIGLSSTNVGTKLTRIKNKLRNKFQSFSNKSQNGR